MIKPIKFTIKPLGIFLIVLLASCAKSPSNVAEIFLSNLQNNQFEEAKKVSTPEAQLLLDNMMKSGSTNPEKLAWAFKITKEETKGDIATVFFTNKPSGKPEIKESVRLIKNEGKWMVSKLALEE